MLPTPARAPKLKLASCCGRSSASWVPAGTGCPRPIACTSSCRARPRHVGQKPGTREDQSPDRWAGSSVDSRVRSAAKSPPGISASCAHCGNATTTNASSAATESSTQSGSTFTTTRPVGTTIRIIPDYTGPQEPRDVRRGDTCVARGPEGYNLIAGRGLSACGRPGDAGVTEYKVCPPAEQMGCPGSAAAKPSG